MRKGPVAVLTVVIGVLAGAGSASALPHSNATGLSHRAVCGPVSSGFAHCNADVVTDHSGNPFKGAPGPSASGTPSGYGPADLRSAYNLTTSGTAGGSSTIAIVDAYDDPAAASDLAAYRNKFSLPPCGGSCFTKLNQNGIQGSYPRGNSGWAQEISLDLDMASAICPNCKILLVEASSNSFANLSAAVDTAAAHGATTSISNSYGGSEFSSEVSSQSHYNHPGIAITVSSGDNGYGVEFPASSEYVTAVGGTSLTGSITGRWSEKAWSGAGSGCSAYITKPSWQTDTGCSRRTVADVAAVADPNTGVAVYDTYHTSGWLVFGGTSVASPIIASVYALAGNAASVNYGSYPYSHTTGLNDVTSGSNGSCGGSYLCTAGTSFDGPTGLGTPNGTGAF
jgi:subtilase family serine protease